MPPANTPSRILPPAATPSAPRLRGFKTFESRGLRVGTQDFLTVDVTLEVGAVQEAITVTGATPVLETTTASVGTLIDRQTLENLPNVGRNPFVISVIAPNVIPTGVPQFTRMQDQNATAMLSLGGGPRRANNFLLDGVPITDFFNRAAIIPSLEARRGSEGAGLDLRRRARSDRRRRVQHAAQVGANAWHGSAMVLDRPEWGTGKLFFTQKRGDPKPETYYHLWSGSFGGPLVKNRTFFWASTEGYKTQTVSNGVLIMPTELERRGDYSQSFDSQGRQIIIYDPLTTRPDPARPGQFIRDPFPGNVIPANRLNPVGQEFVNQLPLPASGRSLPRASLPVADVTNQATVKIDHRLTARQTLSGLFAWYHSREPAPQFLGIPGDPNAVFQPRTVNVARDQRRLHAERSDRRRAALRLPALPRRFGIGAVGSVGRWDSRRRSRARFRVSAHLRGRLCLRRHAASTAARRATARSIRIRSMRRCRGSSAGIPSRSAADYPTDRDAGVRAGRLQRHVRVHPGLHAGAEPERRRHRSRRSIASLLLGYPANGSFNDRRRRTTSTRITSAATCRMIGGCVATSASTSECATSSNRACSERNDAFTVGFDRERPFPIQVPGLDLNGGLMYAGVDGYPTHQGNPSQRNFGPRAGVAWSLDAQTVVRGGYGLFWAPSQIAQAFESGGARHARLHGVDDLRRQ